jgi:hypothetical protein
MDRQGTRPSPKCGNGNIYAGARYPQPTQMRSFGISRCHAGARSIKMTPLPSITGEIKAYSGRTETLPNTQRQARSASGKPMTSKTPIFAFMVMISQSK